MRWKLLIAASLLAAAAGAGAYFGATFLLLALWAGPPGWAHTLMLLAPLAAIIFASIFVYRHTPRRRGLQAAATAVLAALVTLASLFGVFSLLARVG